MTFASITCYFVHRAPASELSRRVDDDFAARICAQPGFVSYEFLDGGGGEAMSITVFREASQAEASRGVAVQWTEAQSPDVELTITESLRGEIIISRGAPKPTAPGEDRYASVRRYRVRDPPETLRRIDAFVASLAELDGFLGYRIVDCGGDELLSISLFRDRTPAAHSDDLAARFVKDELGDLRIERIDTVGGGRVVVSRIAGTA